MGTTILSDCFNSLGRLEGEPLARLRAVLARPSQETWDAAYSLIIAPDGHARTLWQAVLAVKPDFPRSKHPGKPWTQIPDSMTISRAIRNALENGWSNKWRFDGARAELFHDGASVAQRLNMPEARKMACDIFKQAETVNESDQDDDEMGPR